MDMARNVANVIVDIIERPAAEQAPSVLAALLDSSNDAIISKTVDGIIVSWNPGAERAYGYRSYEILGKSISTIIPSHGATEEADILAKLERGECIEGYETARMRKDGGLFHVSLTVSPIKDSEGRLIGTAEIARDITKKKHNLEDLREQYEAAQREIIRRKLAERALRERERRKDEFLATLAHELRSPLAAIRQAARVAQEGDSTGAQKRWALDIVCRQVQMMALLLDDLLDISRITRGTLELRRQRAELRTIIDAAVETVRPTLDARRHALSFYLPPEPVVFWVDPLRLTQVLSNLLANASKYTDPEGHIELRAGIAGGELQISVSDDGIGISPDRLDHVFRMFFQEKSGLDHADGGLGIGLALAKGLVELHDGKIVARSAGLGCGTEFIVYLPIVSGES
jgi:PAS domain S-box-containing protein